ncbi:MAG: helix-turn-helix domain-containing protein [Muribaculaceae bacterium]|nr:helix-turn-helix domain-containing protein [Muribaculaceae bacterium]
MRNNHSFPNSQPINMVVLPQETLDEIMEVVHRAAENQEAASKAKDDEWLSSEEARQILGVSPKTWQNYRDRGIIPFSQTGRKIYVLRSDLDNYLKSHRIARR